MSIDEVLIVRHNGNLFGINTEVIEHILRVLEITPVPLSPTEVRGFCSIEGRIMTVLDLSRLLLNDYDIDTSKDEARLISVHLGDMNYSILIEEVINNITIDKSQLEYISEEKQRHDGVIAAYKYENEIIQILDLAVLIRSIKRLEFKRKTMADRFSTGEEQNYVEPERLRRYFLFMMGQEKYAIDVNKIREVITVPAAFTELSDSSEEILGMITLREELIVIIDLRKVYDLPTNRDEKNRIIIVQSHDKVVGLLIDSILDIADFSASDIDNMPASFKDEKISGIAHIGDSLISIVELGIIDTIIENEARIENTKHKEQLALDDDEEVEIVTFTLSDKNYAIHTEEVIEIIDNFEITLVPDLPEIVKGVTNIRGKVVPVVSLYDKLELSDDTTKAHKMIVCQMEEKPIGIIVDDVKDVKNVSKTQLIPEEESRYFTEIIKSETSKSVTLMLNLKEILKKV